MANVIIDNHSKLDTALMERTITEIVSAYEAVYPATDEKVTFVLLGSDEDYLAYLYDSLDGIHHIELQNDYESMFVMPPKTDDLVIALLAKDSLLPYLEGYFLEKDQGKDIEQDAVEYEFRKLLIIKFFQFAEQMIYEYSRLNSYVEMRDNRSSDYTEWWGLDYILHDTLISNYRGITALLKMAERYLPIKELHSFCQYFAMKYSSDMNRGYERNGAELDKLMAELADYPEETDEEIDVNSFWQKLSHAGESAPQYGSYYSGPEVEEESSDDIDDGPDVGQGIELFDEGEEEYTFTTNDMEEILEYYPQYVDVLYTLMQPAACFEGAQYYGFAQGVYDYLKERTGFKDDTWRMPEENLSIQNVIDIPFYEYVDSSQHCSVVNTLKMITMVKHIGTDFQRLEEREKN